jgi:O-antigen biosynthesis protein
MGINLFEALKRFLLIMLHDYQKRNGIFRIVWKSFLRYRRLGWDGMLEWLDKETGKLPNTQKILSIDTPTYQRWIEKKEPQLFLSTSMQTEIKFSVILILKKHELSPSRMIDSLLSQHSKNWELLIISDVMTTKSHDDTRIVYMTDLSNHTLSEQWNIGRAKATGEWIVLADIGMIFSPYAFLEMAITIQKNPNIKLLYSDEDTISSKLQRSAPHFKSDFNPDLFYSISYIGTAFACNTTIINTIGEITQTTHKSLAYDVVIRIWEHMGENAIYHIPKILFHFEKEQEAHDDECEYDVLKEHFKRINQTVTIDKGLHTEIHRLHWPLPNLLPLVSIIIPTRDHLDILQKCVESIHQKTTYLNYEIIIVDNQSQKDETIHYFDQLSLNNTIRIIRYDGAFNYSAINNFAVTQAKGEVIVLMNNDVEVISSDWLDEMLSHVIRAEIGCVGAMLYYPDNTIQHAGVILGLGDVAGHAHKYLNRGSSGYFNRASCVQNFSAVTAACMAVRKAVYEEVGGLNEKDLTVAYNDVDFCLKVQQSGYRNLWTPFAELYHHESKSRGHENTPDKKARTISEISYMHSHWIENLTHDPYYNPSLTKIAEQFQIRRIDNIR